MRRSTLLPGVVLVLAASLAASPAVAQTTPPSPTTAPEPDVTPSSAPPATTTTTPAPTSTTAAPSTSTTSPTPTSLSVPTTTVTPTAAAPSGAESTTTAPKVRGVGDSVFLSAQTQVEQRLQPEYRPRFRSVLGALVREMTPTALDMGTNHPAAMVFGLGNPDIAELDEPNPPDLDADADHLLRRTGNVPCRVWINVKENGVTSYYHPSWAQAAAAFNDFLDAAAVNGPGADLYAPNLHILDWNAAAARHPGWFLPDGLHLNATGQAGYAGRLDRFLNRVCPPTTG